jgi:5-methylcytosine-specific restriction endonuclease McrA
MHALPKPSIEAKIIYADSYSRIRSVDLKQRHANETSRILDSGVRFADAARADLVDVLDSSDFEPAEVTETEMRDLYDRRVQRKGAPGRPHYDELISSAPHNKCPYCGERRVGSIDHYLPKSTFSSLAVTPTNMVPSCNDCNHAKGSYQPSATRLPVLHPYFDNAEGFRWLHATVEPATTPAVKFEVRVATVIDQRMLNRIQMHFDLFRLAELYGSHAGQAVDELENRLAPVFNNGGANSTRAYLLEEAILQSSGQQNTWKRALYEALADSDWYCSQYFQGRQSA